MALGWLKERLMMPPNNNEVINETPNANAYEYIVKYLHHGT